MYFLRTVRPGDDIEARHLDDVQKALRWSRIVVGQASGLTMDSCPSGITLGLSVVEDFWIKLTAHSGSAYAWTEQLPEPGGAWSDGFQSGTTSTDAAREASGNASPPSLPVIVRARREPASNEVVFRLGSC